MDPTLAGFQDFIANIMMITSAQLAPTNPVIALCYNLAVNIVNPDLRCVPNADATQPNLYAVAVYNLAADMLINKAQDSGASIFFKSLRADLKINSFSAGVITSTADASTSQSMAVSQALENLTIGQLQNLKTPYGREYLAIAQSVNTAWGLT